MLFGLNISHNQESRVHSSSHGMDAEGVDTGDSENCAHTEAPLRLHPEEISANRCATLSTPAHVPLGLEMEARPCLHDSTPQHTRNICTYRRICIQAHSLPPSLPAPSLTPRGHHDMGIEPPTFVHSAAS